MDIKNEDFRKIFDEMPEPAFFHDTDYRLMLVNAAYCKEAGVDAHSVIGQHYWEVFPKGKGPLDCCKHAFLSEAVNSSRERISVGDKTFISFSYVNRDNKGLAVNAFHIMADVTPLSLAERALQKASAEHQILFDLSPDAIMLLDEKAFFDCNPATLKIFGCAQRSDFIGKHPSQFSPSLQPGGVDSMALANQRIAEAFGSGSNFFEWDHCKLDGTPFPAEVLLVAFELEGKKVLQATVRDITARKNLDEQLSNYSDRLSRALAGTIRTMSRTMELRDPYTAGHQNNVAQIACAIASELGWDEESIVGLKMAGLIHDIGKIAVPAEILTKPSALSGFEEKLVQLHPEQGYELLKDIEFPWPVADMVHQHHERIDGSGYPLGLRGDQILPGAKILAVADTLEAMSTHRPYRAALGLPAAIAQIKAESGKQLDAVVVSAAVKLFDGKESLDLGAATD